VLGPPRVRATLGTFKLFYELEHTGIHIDIKEHSSLGDLGKNKKNKKV